MKTRKYRTLKRVTRTFVVSLLILAVTAYFYLLYPFWGIPFNAQRHGNPPLTPAWALECWLWEDDVNTAEYVDELLDGYAENDIPVRTVIIDSPWSYRYNDFDIDTSLYPNPDQWFTQLQDEGYRVVLWMTTMVNSYNKDLELKNDEEWFEAAKENGYLISGGIQNKWWKGKGGFIDYTNPEATDWWRGMQQKVFDLGIDGWKLDGTATLFWSNLGPVPMFYKDSHAGLMTTREYMDLYYRSEYRHGLTQNPEFVTLSRSMDRGYHPEGFAPIDAAPVTWVGDQEHKWVTDEMIKERGSEQIDIALEGIQGFESAVESILKSAEAGYNIIGSDIGGFSGRDIPPRLYIRWAQFSTFCGLFMNGGHGERRLWKRSRQELEIIRKYSWLHTELIPYMYHYVVTGHLGGKLLQTPVRGKYHYMFGDYLLIAPIYKDQLENRVHLPEGNWRYWFDDSEIIEGPVTFEKEFSPEEYPVFIRAGAIIPMDIKRDYTGIGSAEDEGFLTFLIYPDNKLESFEVFREKAKSTKIRYERSDVDLTVSLEGKHVPHILQIALDQKPQSVELDGKPQTEGGQYEYDEKRKKLIIKTSSYTTGNYQISL